MKKLIALILAMLFVGVGIASATDLTITGSYYARGTYIDNWSGDRDDAESYGQYDHELTFDTKWQIDDTTQVFARFEVRDETWGVANNPREDRKFDEDPTAQFDDNIHVEQVWGTHTFNYGGNIKVGLMTAGAWGTDFGNTSWEEKYRVFYTQPTQIGSVVAILEKPGPTAENSFLGETGELDKDTNSYILGLVSQAGGVNIMPLIVYGDVDIADIEKLSLQLSMNGASGNIGWETDFIWTDVSMPDGSDDYDTYGLYGKIWAQFDAFTIGGLLAYGSYDDTAHKGFDFGDDFTAGGAQLLGDEVYNGYDSLEGFTLFAITASYAVSDALSFGAYFGYADSNVDDPTSDWDGADIWEVSATMVYKITDNVTYDIAAGTAQVSYGDATTLDPDAAVEVFHRLTFSF